MAVFAAGLFVLTILPIDANNVGSLETDVFRSLNGWPEAIYRALWANMQLGNLVVVPLASLAAVLIFRRMRLAGALAAAGLLAWWLAKVIKQIVPRGRPAELVTDVMLRDAPATGNGYISGHAAVVFALIAVASPYMNRWVKGVAWMLGIGVCLARVYVGAHLPLDVVGGAAFGFVIGSLVNIVIGVPVDRAEVAV